jgi:hypothetical protein
MRPPESPCCVLDRAVTPVSTIAVQYLRKMRASDDGLVHLDDTTFKNLVTSGAKRRDFPVVVAVVALSPRVGCTVCRCVRGRPPRSPREHFFCYILA